MLLLHVFTHSLQFQSGVQCAEGEDDGSLMRSSDHEEEVEAEGRMNMS